MSEHNLKQVLAGDKPGTVHALPQRDFGQETARTYSQLKKTFPINVSK